MVGIVVGKPYSGELESLSRTYEWAQKADVNALASSLGSCASAPLITVGSGGSLTSAYLASYFHSLYTGMLARPMTPYELAFSPVHLSGLGLLLLTAGGGNPDVLGCFKAAISRAPKHCVILCTRSQTLLAELAHDACGVFFHEYDLPTMKDGFLATNSLLATCVLLARAYHPQNSLVTSLPPRFEDLAHPGSTSESFRAGLSELCQPLWTRSTIVVLHGHVTQAAAIDLESKFTEAAIGHIQLADYRNFAHGRHHWLAKHPSSSAIISLTSDDDVAVARKTLSLLPKEIPVARFNVASGVAGCLQAVTLSLYIAGLAGQARGIDPGRPSVPLFGRKLYHLGGGYRERIHPRVQESEAVAIIRKAGAGIATLDAQGQLLRWREAYAAFLDHIHLTEFRAIVFDYDGTLCDAQERYRGIRQPVTDQLIALLHAGIVVAIATGRGQSVRNDFRKRIDDPALMSRLMIGYHNGAEIGFLADDSQPPVANDLDASLVEINAALRADARLASLAKIKAGRRQITLKCMADFATEQVWESVQIVLSRHHFPGVSSLRSSHSIDILAPGVTKVRVVEEIRKALGHEAGQVAVLCIGDRGRWPGNDFDLLQEPCSLSVDEVSGDPSTCWNLASAKVRFASALLEYFQRMRIRDGSLTLRF